MRSRKAQIALGIGIVVVAVVVALLLTRPSAEGPYALTAWDYGAVAWVEPIPEDLESATTRAAELFAGVFELWGFSAPVAIPEGRVARKRDPAGGASVDLYALDWKGAILPPVMLLVFPAGESLREATGLETGPIVLTYGEPPEPTYDEVPVPIAVSDWVAELAGASVTFVLTADCWEEHLVGETAKWMLRKGTQIPELCECTPYGLPMLVEVGFAGYTVSRLLGGDGWLASATEWAAANGIGTDVSDLLEFDVDPATLSALGTSFVAYLVGEHGTDEMVSAICAWRGTGQYCSPSAARTISYIRGWRAYLGVEPE